MASSFIETGVSCTLFYRKNCSGSPHCFNGLGEKKWLSNDDPVLPNIDPDSWKRGEVWYKILLFLFLFNQLSLPDCFQCFDAVGLVSGRPSGL